MSFTRGTVSFEDDVGKDAKTAFLVSGAGADQGGTAIQALKSAFVAATNAEAYRSEAGTMNGGTGNALKSGQTTTVEDRVVMTFRTAVNGTINYEIPGPISSIFSTANVDEVDPANAAVATYVAAVTAIAKDKYGNAVTTFVSGKRIRKKQMKQ